MHKKIAVLTIVKGRSQALRNLVKGLQGNKYIPMELVIIHMNEDPCECPPCEFEIRSLKFESDEKLPLAAARNYAAAQTSAECLIFLDVDCIPAPGFMQDYADAFSTSEHLWSGTVRYLRKDYPGSLTEMEKWSTADPVRAGLSSLPYELFWSLNFGCSRQVYQQIGGFDERYHGYGAEDTDFSFQARAAAIPLLPIKALAYHQYHPSYDPPLNHLQDIVENANVFYAKWKRWPMEGWLQKFERRGLISGTPEYPLRILRYPTDAETAACLKT